MTELERCIASIKEAFSRYGTQRWDIKYLKDTLCNTIDKLEKLQSVENSKRELCMAKTMSALVYKDLQANTIQVK